MTHTPRPDPAEREAVEALSEAWGSEPWEPIQWQQGDRVQILSRPECYYCREEGESEAGLVGRVHSIETIDDPEDWSPEALAHRYHVVLDEPEQRIVYYLAAIELQPADARDDAAGEGE